MLWQRFTNQAIGDRVPLLEHIEEKERSRRHIIPGQAKEKPRGKFIAIGTGKKGEDGKVTQVRGQVGDRVLSASYAAPEVKIDRKEITPPRSRGDSRRHRLSFV